MSTRSGGASSYTEEFRRAVVSILKRRGSDTDGAAKSLGIAPEVLAEWFREFDPGFAIGTAEMPSAAMRADRYEALLIRMLRMVTDDPTLLRKPIIRAIDELADRIFELRGIPVPPKPGRKRQPVYVG